MKVKYKGPKTIAYDADKVYDIISVEKGWYRLMSEMDESYLLPPKMVEIIDWEESTSEEFTKEEKCVLSEKANNPEKEVLCPHCKQELIFDEFPGGYTIKCTSENCLQQVVRLDKPKPKVQFIGKQTTDSLTEGKLYEVLSIGERKFLLKNDMGEEKCYPAEKFRLWTF